MITIKNIDDQLEDINTELLSEDDKKKLPTYRFYFKVALGLFIGRKPEDAVDAFALGGKVKESGPDLKLENAEFELLKSCVEANPGRWPNIFYSQMILKLRHAENKKN